MCVLNMIYEVLVSLGSPEFWKSIKKVFDRDSSHITWLDVLVASFTPAESTRWPVLVQGLTPFQIIFLTLLKSVQNHK